MQCGRQVCCELDPNVPAKGAFRSGGNFKVNGRVLHEKCGTKSIYVLLAQPFAQVVA